MLPRSSRKKKQMRNWAEKQYEKHLRHNRHFAEPGCHDIVLVLDHLKSGFNIAKIFRSADAFGIREIHLVGIDFFPTAAAKGAFKYVPAIFHTDFSTCYQRLRQHYSIFMLVPGGEKCLGNCDLPKKSAFIFGNEEMGISFDPADYPDIGALTIGQYGRVESLNVSVAASIVMYEYVRQQGE